MTPYVDSVAQTPVPGGRVGDERHDHRSRQRHELPLPRHRPRTASARARCRRPPTSRRRRRRSSTSRRRAPSIRVTTAASSWASSSATDFDGAVTGVRFYKAATNTGTHVGSLWTTGGTLLASATFTERGDQRLAVGDLQQPGAADVGDDLRRVVLRAQRPLLGHRQRLRVRDAERAPRGARQRHERQRRVRLRRVEPLPEQHLGRRQLLGRRAASRPLRQPGPVVDRRRVRRPDLGDDQLVRAVRAAARSARTRSRRTSARRRRRPSARRSSGRRRRRTRRSLGSPPAPRTRFTVRASNQTGAGPESAQSNAVTPTAPSAPGTPANASGPGRLEGRDRKLVRAVGRRQRDHPLHVTPYVDSAAQTPVNVDAPATRARVTGLTNGSTYTFRVSATNAAGTGSASAASNAVTPRRLDLRVCDADNGRRRRRWLRRARGQGQLDCRRLDHRRAVLQGRGEHRHPRRRAVDRGWHAARAGHRDERDVVGLAGRHLQRAGRHHGRHHLRRELPGTERPLLRHKLRVRLGGGQRAAAALANSVSGNGVYRYSASSVFPTNNFNASNYSVDVLFNPA